MNGIIGAFLNNEEEEDDDEHRRLRIHNMRRNNKIRRISNPFDTLDDRTFLNRFRLPKHVVLWLCEQVEPYIPDDRVGQAFSKQVQILCALRFYATGCFQTALADTCYFNMSQASVCRIITIVTRAIISALQDEWIIFPTDAAELQRISEAEINPRAQENHDEDDDDDDDDDDNNTNDDDDDNNDDDDDNNDDNDDNNNNTNDEGNINDEDKMDVDEAALNARVREERKRGRQIRENIVQQYFGNNE